MNFLKNILNKISKSCREESGRESHTRISSYIILIVIIISSLVFLGIDIINLISSIQKGETYEIPYGHITLFGMMLSHHLFLLGIKKNSENKKAKYENLYKNDIDKSKLKSKSKSKDKKGK